MAVPNIVMPGQTAEVLATPVVEFAFLFCKNLDHAIWFHPPFLNAISYYYLKYTLSRNIDYIA